MIKLPLLMTAREGPGQLVRRSYQEGDETAFRPREDFLAHIDAAGQALPRGPKATITRGGEPVAVGGLHPWKPGSWTLWMRAGELSPREWAFAAEAAMDAVRTYVREGLATHVETFVREDQPRSQAFVMQLGFAPTGGAWDAPDGCRQLLFTLGTGE